MPAPSPQAPLPPARRMSPAQAHKLRVEATQAAAKAAATPPGPGLGANRVGDQMRAALWGDMQVLKGIKSIQRKAEAKRNMLPAYAPYVDGILAARPPSGAPDDVLLTIMAWRLDVGDLPGALPIAAYALEHGLPTPDRFARDTATLLAEEAADLTLGSLTGPGTAPDPDPALAALSEHLEHVARLTDGADMHDQVRAKLRKAQGYARYHAGQLPEARAALLDAFELNERVGVKKDLERLARMIQQARDEDPE